MSGLSPRLEQFALACDELADRIEVRSETLLQRLLVHEVYDAAKYEIAMAQSTLRGMRSELLRADPEVCDLHVASYFPLNQPLWALVLFAVSPAAYSDRVYVRPPLGLESLVSTLMLDLDMAELFPNITVHAVSRKLFAEMYVAESDAIIFTGKYENAEMIARNFPDAALVYSGTGVNPFIAFDDANVDLLVEKAVDMRCFNSGQDCTAPDAFLVPSELADQFQSQLASALARLRIGATTDITTDIGPLIRRSYADAADEWLSTHRQNIVFGGTVDHQDKVIEPTIVRTGLARHRGEFHEFFSPVHYILEYSSHGELIDALRRREFTDRAMYASLFGTPSPELLDVVSQHCNVLYGESPRDAEDGNEAFGGWGVKANFVSSGGVRVVRPILVSQELASPVQDLAQSKPQDIAA